MELRAVETGKPINAHSRVSIVGCPYPTLERAQAAAAGCKSKEEREREQLDREQTRTMEKLLAAQAERELHDGAPRPPTAIDAGAH